MRDYEISLWTQDDEFIDILGTNDNYYANKLYNPILSLSLDAQDTLTFNIPIIYTRNDTHSIINNKDWYENLVAMGKLANEQKIKLIFNKAKKLNRESGWSIYEFVIQNFVEKRSDKEVYCEITCNGLAGSDLGKDGTTIILDSDTLLAEEEDSNITITPTINYWLDKVFPQIDGVWVGGWSYDIQMDYSYDMIVGKLSTKCYEENNIVGYDDNNNPIYNTQPVEKARFLSIKDSNRYNITQDIAEAFGIYVKYIYEYNDLEHPLKITGRKVVFYNSLVQDTDFTISYGNNEKNISKTALSDDIKTKIYVSNLENSDSPDGYISIADASSNFMKDDFILDFGYYIEKGLLSPERQELIPTFESTIRLFNSQLASILQNKYAKQNEIADLEVQQKTLEDQMTAATEVINDCTDKINAIGAQLSTQILTDTKVAYIIKKLDDDYNTVTFTRSGVLDDATFAVRTSGNVLITNAVKIYNQYGFISGIKVDQEAFPIGLIIYITYHYDVLSYYRANLNTYQTAYDSYQNKYDDIDIKLVSANNALALINGNYINLFNQKKQAIADFDGAMGYFLKEGTWTPSDYSSPSENKVDRVIFTDALLDPVALSGENLSYYMVEETPTYYNYILADSFLADNVINNLTIYKKNNILNSKNIYVCGAHFTIEYYKVSNKYHKVLLFDKNVVLNSNGEDRFYYITSSGTEVDITQYFCNALTDIAKQGTICRLRYTIASTSVYDSTIGVNIATTELQLNNNPLELTLYYDYIVTSNLLGQKVITLKNTTTNLPMLPFYGDISYKRDRTVDQLYADALDVAHTAAYPTASYEIDFMELKNILNTDVFFNMDDAHVLLSTDANNRITLMLGSIIRINDILLHLQNIKGLVNKLTLSLENPSDDKITVQNYKTKFEDLFTKIVRSSETLQSNLLGYNRAASAILPTGEINVSLLQNAIDRNNLVLRSGIKSGVVQNEDGIFIKNLTPYPNGAYGIVALRGGGIFLSDSEDSSGAPVYLAAITPKGINANVITAGRLDTEKINIYSGDQIRFTWKADGLFAYNQLGNGAIDYSTYVKFSEDGLSLSEDSNGTRINRVEVGWAGFILRNNMNEVVFNANPDDGDLEIAGSVYLPNSNTAFIGTKEFTSGSLGNGWRIQGNGNAEFNNLTMRGKISASVFEYNKISSIGGELYLAPTLIMPTNGMIDILDTKYTFTFVNSYGSTTINGLTWMPADIVMLQGFIQTNNNCYELRKVLCSITTISESSIVLTTIDDIIDIDSYSTSEDVIGQQIAYVSTDILQTGATLMYHGHDTSGIITRRGLYLTSGNTTGAYIDIYDLDSALPKVRLGDLSGILDSSLQTNPSGYGLYAQNAFLKGDIYANTGAIGEYLKLESSGILLQNPSDPNMLLAFGYYGGQFGLSYSQDNGTTWSTGVNFGGTVLDSSDSEMLNAHSTQISYLTDGIAQRVTQDTLDSAMADKVTTDDLDSRFEALSVQTATNITNTFNITQASIDELTGQFDDYKTQVSVYQRFSNEGYMELGRTDSPFIMRLSNEKLSFMQSGMEIAYFSNNKLNVNEIETPAATIANFQWIINGIGTGLKWRG